LHNEIIIYTLNTNLTIKTKDYDRLIKHYRKRQH